jgi:hypothetical protein
MNDRIRFASLLFVKQMGILSKEQLIAAADARIIELERPVNWLIELSTDGDSKELEDLIVSANDEVYLEALRLAYSAWVEERITVERFLECCRPLWNLAGFGSRWYQELSWIEDEFDLANQGVFRREDATQKIKTRVEKLLGSAAQN